MRLPKMDQSGDIHFPIRHAFLSEKGVLGFRWVGGILIFVVASGLAIWFSPFSVPAEFAVLMHTALGLALVIPLTPGSSVTGWRHVAPEAASGNSAAMRACGR